MPLFVVLRDGVELDATLMRRLKHAIKSALSARHVPNEIFQVAAIPRTLSGKKMELPVKKLLLGTPADQVFKRDAMANAAAVDWFVEFARAPRLRRPRAVSDEQRCSMTPAIACWPPRCSASGRSAPTTGWCGCAPRSAAAFAALEVQIRQRHALLQPLDRVAARAAQRFAATGR